jgi:hypothetical protein
MLHSLAPLFAGERVGVRGFLHVKTRIVASLVRCPSPEIRYREFRPLPAKERGEVKKRPRTWGEVKEVTSPVAQYELSS